MNLITDIQSYQLTNLELSTLAMTTLEEVASNGVVKDWNELRPAICEKLSQTKDLYDDIGIITDPLTLTQYTFNKVIEQSADLLNRDFAQNPPFTIQRLCELLLDPLATYEKSRPDKLGWALRAMLSVSNDEYPQIDFDEEIKNDIKNNASGSKAVSGVCLTAIPWASASASAANSAAPSPDPTGTAAIDEVDTGIIMDANGRVENSEAVLQVAEK